MSDEQKLSQSEPNSDEEVTLAESTSKNGMILAIFALVTVALTALTFVLTKDRIQSEKEQALLRAIGELIPADQFANDPYSDCIQISDPSLLGSPYPQKVWRLRDEDNQPVGLILSGVAPNGYTGPIEFIAGYTQNNNVTELAGVRVTSHQETPGLGDKIDLKKSAWILSLGGHEVATVKEPEWAVTKDGGEFDAFTGATITPRALLKAVTNATEYFRVNREMLFTTPSNCANDGETND